VNIRFTIRLLRALAALLLAFTLLTPNLYGAVADSGEQCSCCAKGARGKLCCRRLKSHGSGPAFSSAACPEGCAQSPALPVAAPALLSAKSAASSFAAPSARLLPSLSASRVEHFAAFALFQRPPPSL